MAQTLTEFDTIAAISTPIGEGGISIVRMSGEDAVKIANEVFKGANLAKVPVLYDIFVFPFSILIGLEYEVLSYANISLYFNT